MSKKSKKKGKAKCESEAFHGQGLVGEECARREGRQREPDQCDVVQLLED